MMAEIEITILNAMAGRDFDQALDQHRTWGIRVLDLKDAIYGKPLLALTDDEAACAANAIRIRGLATYCLSTGLFNEDVEKGEAAFSEGLESQIDRVIALADCFQPRVVRLLAARSSRRPEVPDGIEYIADRHPWLIDLYRRVVDRLHAAGHGVTIENEAHDCLLASPEEVRHLFELIDRRGKVFFTWDVQNMWQMGTFPSLDVYRQIRDLTGYYHVKGGQTDGGQSLVWRSSLADADWPVAEITRQVVEDGQCEAICINPSHGRAKPGYGETDVTARDLQTVRRILRESP